MKMWIIRGIVVLALGGTAAMATPSYTAVFLPSSGFSNAEAIGFLGSQIAGNGNSDSVALLWPTVNSTPLNLTQSGYDSTDIQNSNADSAVGIASMGAVGHAALWQNGGATFTDLNPNGFYDTVATGVAGGQQAGFGYVSNTSGAQALLWEGTANSVVNLHPAGYAESFANATDGIHQVGSVTTSPDFVSHAAMWSGTASSFVDINPAGATYSAALAISGNLVGGDADFTSDPDEFHATLWNLTTGITTDLNPVGATSSVIGAITGNYQVGYSLINDAFHADIWQGTSSSVIDLNSFLPSGYISAEVFGVDAMGDVVGAASNVDGDLGSRVPVIWLVPEPSAFAMLISCSGLFLMRKRSG